MAKRVCIIGGGVIGLASAYALVRAGMDVTLVEGQSNLGGATSFANGGQLSYRYVTPLADAGVPLEALVGMLGEKSPIKLRLRMDPLQWRWLWSFLGACRASVNLANSQHLLRLAALSQDTLQRWRYEDRLESFDWQRNGRLLAFRSADCFAQARSRMSDPLQQVLSAEDCRRLEPSLNPGTFVGGIYNPTEEVADCHTFCQRLAERLEASGRCRFLVGRKVLKIHDAFGSVVAIELQDEVLPVDNLVLAAGYNSQSLSLPNLHLPLYPLKGYSLTMPIEEHHTAPSISTTDYERKAVYARIGERLRVAAMIDIVGFNTALESKRLALMKNMARQTFPMAGNYDAAVEWTGMRPATPTGLPLIGSTAYRNLWLNLGHGALGFTLACGSGQLLAEMIDARSTSIDAGVFLPKAA